MDVVSWLFLTFAKTVHIQADMKCIILCACCTAGVTKKVSLKCFFFTLLLFFKVIEKNLYQDKNVIYTYHWNCNQSLMLQFIAMNMCIWEWLVVSATRGSLSQNNNKRHVWGSSWGQRSCFIVKQLLLLIKIDLTWLRQKSCSRTR